ncbi:hypothetical protein PsYK624_062630 [Phanerochaete sordida]|uniref:Uncharacterized protein n=1 Tax=Phanerochaete sordida TaxID=48140 RepID=A0A9P3GA34_9APHY|nr:hypothetical protein PsYK624_062630 [Phanerochaete sordida]
MGTRVLLFGVSNASTAWLKGLSRRWTTCVVFVSRPSTMTNHFDACAPDDRGCRPAALEPTSQPAHSLDAPLGYGFCPRMQNRYVGRGKLMVAVYRFAALALRGPTLSNVVFATRPFDIPGSNLAASPSRMLACLRGITQTNGGTPYLNDVRLALVTQSCKRWHSHTETTQDLLDGRDSVLVGPSSECRAIICL